eukprot:1070044-Rhodomonas_salina.6
MLAPTLDDCVVMAQTRLVHHDSACHCPSVCFRISVGVAAAVVAAAVVATAVVAAAALDSAPF